MKMIRRSQSVAAVLLAVSAVVLAQAPEPAPDRQKARPDWRARQRGGRGDRMGPGAKWGGEGGFRPDARMKELFEKLKEQDPERFDQLTQLRETDPEAFRSEIRQVMQQRFKGRRTGTGAPAEQKCVELSGVYRRTKDEQKRQQIKAELRTAVEEAFDARVEERLKRLERMEQEIQRIRREIEARQGNRDEICTQRVGELTQDPQYRWDW